MSASVDQELIARCLAGSDDAWSELVERHSRLIYSITLKYGLNQEDASDVFQTVCLHWWQSLDQLREADRLPGWLATMTGRAAWRLISGRRRSRDHESSQAEEILYLVPSKDPLPEDLLLAAERSAGLRSEVKRLDDRCRHLVTALFISPEPPDYASIAEELGLAEGSIGSLRKRCLERLRRMLAAPTMPDAFSDTSADTVIEAGGERGRHDR